MSTRPACKQSGSITLWLVRRRPFQPESGRFLCIADGFFAIFGMNRKWREDKGVTGAMIPGSSHQVPRSGQWRASVPRRCRRARCSSAPSTTRGNPPRRVAPTLFSPPNRAEDGISTLRNHLRLSRPRHQRPPPPPPLAPASEAHESAESSSSPAESESPVSSRGGADRAGMALDHADAEVTD